MASAPTAWRTISACCERDRLDGLRAARAQARERAWAAGAAPAEIVLDFDSHLVTCHSDKEGAAPTWKRGFGFHPLLCYLDATGEAARAAIAWVCDDPHKADEAQSDVTRESVLTGEEVRCFAVLTGRGGWSSRAGFLWVGPARA